MASLRWQDIIDAYGGSPAKANSAIAAQREGWAKDSRFEGMSQEDLAEGDRFTHGATFGQGMPGILGATVGVPIAGMVGAGNELAKLSPQAQAAIARITGDQTFLPAANTSKPSMRNVMALMRGAFEGSVYRR